MAALRLISALLLSALVATGAFAQGKKSSKKAAPAPVDELPQLISTTGGGPKWKTLKELEAFANKGDPQASMEMGDRLLEGDGFPKDPARARSYFEKAAESGVPNAFFRLGKIHHDGLGVRVDRAKGFEFFLEAAKRGVAEAQYNVGAMLASGRGVRRNFVEGLAWLIVAGKSGATGGGEAQLRERMARRPADIAAAEKRAAELLAAIASGGEVAANAVPTTAGRRADSARESSPPPPPKIERPTFEREKVEPPKVTVPVAPIPPRVRRRRGARTALITGFASARRASLRGAMLPAADTIAALATPVGTSAIALVRASGPAAGGLVRGIFGVEPAARVAQRADYRDRSGALVDDVLFTWFAADASYTGEETLEISCHGNPFIAQRVLGDLIARGCRAAGPGEFTQRAFLNGRLDLSQAEAVMDLIHARSERALAAANQQLRGALGRRMEGLVNRGINCLAQVEAYIDFPEEDLPPEDTSRLDGELDELIRATAQLLATSHYGELLRSGIKTVILGEPNAGKSSLLNRLLGRDRALVSPEPGTTRDYLEEPVTVGPHLLRLIDTAGLNPTPTALEARGIEKTREQAVGADLFLWVIDSTRALPALPPDLLAVMAQANTIAVFNKLDLPPAPVDALPKPFPRVHVSALHGAGFEALQAAIIRLADSFRIEVGDELIAVNARHAAALVTARECLEGARGKLRGAAAAELVASDLRGALDAFAQIAGRVDNERMLDQLFATFCIGK